MSEATLPDLYPATAPYRHGFLPEKDGHAVYFEESGQASGVPVVFLHGGPGSGCGPRHRQLFHPTHVRAVLFDQRGCGRSQAKRPLQANTTADLIDDIERLREYLQIDRWLVVGRSVDQIYPIVRDFWKESGFTFTRENPVLGLLETEWAENRAKLPQDVIRRTLGKVLDGLYSTGERDKYRTQLEPLTAQSTEIRISHRGMVEVYTSVVKDATVWQPRPSDPGLENEFLRRLMLKLGAPAQQADQAVAQANLPNTSAKAENIAGQTSIFLNEGFDIAWRRVGLALDRTGFTVEDRDRRTGTYFVRFVDTPNDKEGNFVTRMFKAKKVPVPVKYRIAITAQVSGGSRAVVQGTDGQNESSPTSQKIATLLLDELK